MKNISLLMVAMMLSAPAFAKVSPKASNNQARNAASAKLAADPNMSFKSDIECKNLQSGSLNMASNAQSQQGKSKSANSLNGVN